jgi:hypothetical protein
MWGEVIGLALLAGALVWLLRGRRSPSRSGEPAPADRTSEEKEAAEELERAEDEVRERESSARPEDEEPGHDWGPGTPRSY